MALFRRQNVICAGGNHCTWWLMKTMLDAGWTMPFSGSGVGGLYATSNVFDTNQLPQYWSLLGPNNQGIGSEPWGHANCWAVMEDPAGNRQYVFMRDNSASNNGDDEWYIGYSPGGRFGEGQIAGTDWDADTPPAAPDQINMWATPTAWSQLFEPGGTLSLMHVIADSTPSPEGEYGVFLVNVLNPNNPYTAIVFDDVRQAPVGHPHPLTFLITRSSAGVFLIGSSLVRTIYDYGGGGEAWVTTNYAYPRYAGSACFPNSAAINSDGKERAIRALVGFGGSTGYMGVSRWLAWRGVAHTYPMSANDKVDVFVDDAVIQNLLDGAEGAGTV